MSKEKNRANTFEEHCKICFSPTIASRLEEKWWGVINRPISLRISYLLVKYCPSILPNHITFLVVVLSLCGFALLIQGWVGVILFFALCELWAIFDCVDGEMARAKNIKSLFGVYMDSLGHYASYIGIFIPVGIRLTGDLGTDRYIYFGFICSILMMLAAISHQMKVIVLYKKGIFNGVIAEKAVPFYIKIYRFLVGTLELAGVVTLLFIVSSYVSLTVRGYIWEGFFIFYTVLLSLSLLLQVRNVRNDLNKIKV